MAAEPRVICLDERLVDWQVCHINDTPNPSMKRPGPADHPPDMNRPWQRILRGRRNIQDINMLLPYFTLAHQQQTIVL